MKKKIFALLISPRCRLIQLSTDYVFDGQSHRPYLTTDTPRPISVYGVTKWEGENAVLDVLASRAVVLRTAWLYSAVGTNFLHSMLAAMRAHRTVRVVNDQWGAPTATPSVAAVIWQLTDRPEFSGIAHWTDQGAVTRFEWARAIAEDATAVGLLRDDITVNPVGTADYPTAARRPPYSVLDTRQTALTLGRSPAPWRDRLREILARLVMQERSPTHLSTQRLSSPH